jgi:arylsulfatase A-like enzyme
MSEGVSRRGLFSRVALGAIATAAVGGVGYEAWLLLRRKPMEDLYGPYPDASLLKPLKVVNPAAEKPNIIVIYCDDLGYGDLGCYGSTAIETPNIDKLAAGGLQCSDYYACSAVCSPSRTGLLTGRYPFRAGMTGNPYPKNEATKERMLRNFSTQMAAMGASDLHEDYYTAGLDQRELTLAEGLKVAGYRTAMVGKWHLGDFSQQPEYHPMKFGFDSFYGVPHSNDMRPCPLYDGDKQIAESIRPFMGEITGRYTAEALKAIDAAGDDPFFLYLAHTFPHQPLAASEKFAGKSAGGAYGDTVEEIDWSVGEIMAMLERKGIADKTMVVFTSDNGRWYEGSSGVLRGGKGTTYDGAFKVPFIAHWPGRIPAGSKSSELIANLDLFPTFFGLAGVGLPEDRVLDGYDILGVLTGTAAKSPRETLYYYHYDELQGVRHRNWKYIRKTNRYVWPIPLDAEWITTASKSKQMSTPRWPLLYDLSVDPAEAYNVIARNADVARQLDRLMTEWQNANRKNPRGFTALAA